MAGASGEDTVCVVARRSLTRSTSSLVLLAAAALGQACLDWSKLENGVCGDGFVGREEACDDGNRISGDGCSDSCKLEPAVCGDGRRDPGEGCDDANNSNDDDCVEGCHLAACGDGHVRQFVEQCDDGNQVDGDGCSKDCALETVETGPHCGDGKLDPPEVCDDGNQSNGDSCLIGCSFAACGDGYVRQGVEECDVSLPDPPSCHACMSCGGTPDSYFRPGSSHCYTLHQEDMSEPQARAACQAEGGDLWTVTSQAEGSDVTEKLALAGVYWLGLLTTSSGDSWISGESTKYTSFAAGEPSDPALRCVAFDGTTGGTWRSRACAKKLAFVCERSPALVFGEDHHAYRLRTGALDVTAARSSCSADGGHLAALETDPERQFIGKNVGVAAWVDANDDALEGHFVWPSGEPVDPTAFAGNQPDDTDGSQGCLLLNAGDKFADAACSEPHAYLCELD